MSVQSSGTVDVASQCSASAGRPAVLCGVTRLRVEEEQRDDRAEGEAADVREEGDAAFAEAEVMPACASTSW